MHQRRLALSHQEHVRLVTTALLQRWWTAKDLAAMLGTSKSLAIFTVKAIARQRVVFARKTTHFRKPREYRLYPEARGVRRG